METNTHESEASTKIGKKLKHEWRKYNTSAEEPLSLKAWVRTHAPKDMAEAWFMSKM